MFENFMALLSKLETVIDKGAVFVKQVAPVAKSFAPLAGPDAAAVIAGATAAQAIATATDEAIQEHQAAGGTSQSAVAALTKIAGSVAASDVTDDATATKITTLLGAIQAI